MNDISKEELDVIMACAAFQLFGTALKDDTKVHDLCKELCGGGDIYNKIMKKAFLEGISGNLPSKIECVLSHVLRETFPSVLKLSGSIQ